MGTNDIKISIFQSPAEAPHYSTTDYKAAHLTDAVVVRNGTVEGHATVDLIFEDNSGQKYVGMITARLLHAVGKVAGT